MSAHFRGNSVYRRAAITLFSGISCLVIVLDVAVQASVAERRHKEKAKPKITSSSAAEETLSDSIGDDNPWKKQIPWIFEELEKCQGKQHEGCGVFVARALFQVFELPDFDLDSARGSLLFSSKNNFLDDLGDYLKYSYEWQTLGKANDQAVLQAAQDEANQGKPVVAYSFENNQRQAALILPGELKASSTWKIKVPRAVCFFAQNPKKSFVGQVLAFVWNKPGVAEIFVYRPKNKAATPEPTATAPEEDPRMRMR